MRQTFILRKHLHRIGAIRHKKSQVQTLRVFDGANLVMHAADDVFDLVVGVRHDAELVVMLLLALVLYSQLNNQNNLSKIICI